MVWNNPQEIAKLTIDGTDYYDWETVLVRHQLREPPLYYARFTASEFTPFETHWMALQIMPGADCTISLGGLLAFTGKVTTRQVFYDARRHYIEIQCANFQQIITGSVVHESHEWKKDSFTLEQIIRDVLQPAKLNLVVEGGQLPQTKLPMTIRATPGETIFDFIDHLVRSAGQDTGLGISFTSNVKGDFVLLVGPNGGTDAVTEGQNIIEGRETIYDKFMGHDIVTASQGPGSNKSSGAQVAHEPWFSKAFEGLGNKFNPALIISELPGSNLQILRGRTTNEQNWMTEDLITVFATVQGWMRPSGGLWYRGQNVVVNSQMLVMDGISLILKSVNFTQDNATGTRSVLELVNANVLDNLAPQENQ